MGCYLSKTSLSVGLCGIHSVNRFNRFNCSLRPSLTDDHGLGFWRLNANPGGAGQPRFPVTFPPVIRAMDEDVSEYFINV